MAKSLRTTLSLLTVAVIVNLIEVEVPEVYERLFWCDFWP